MRIDDTSWYAIGNQEVECPFPGCNHVANIITKAHCRIVHNMEREEVGRLYGAPKNRGGRAFKL